MNVARSDAFTRNCIEKLVGLALEKLLQQDNYLLIHNANERSMAARLCIYFQEQFPKWHVDCEYNRDGIDPKKLSHLDIDPDQEDTDARTVFPDIVVHLRGTANNLLVIEIKKSNSSVLRSIDFAKLRGYKRELGYTFALFIEFNVGDSPAIGRCEWVDSD
jgi:hypothetical protein